MAEKRSKYGLLNLNFEDLYNGFMGLEDRAQTLTVLGLVVVFLMLLVLPVTCASSKLGQMQEEFDKGKKSIEDLVKKVGDYELSRSKLQVLRKKFSTGANESMSTVMESLANEVGIGSNVDRLRPVNLDTTEFYDEVGVDATVSKITLDQAVQFIDKIEKNSKIPMRIKKLEIKPSYQNRQLLTVMMQVSTVKPKGGNESE